MKENGKGNIYFSKTCCMALCLMKWIYLRIKRREKEKDNRNREEELMYSK